MHHVWVVRPGLEGVEQGRIARREMGTPKSLSSEIPDSFEQRDTSHQGCVCSLLGCSSAGGGRREAPAVPAGVGGSQ